MTLEFYTQGTPKKKARTAISTSKKLVVQGFNEALCFVSSSVVADSFVLRNPLLHQVLNRQAQL